MQINKINNKNRKNTLTTPILDVSSPSISLLAPLLPSKRQISIFENPSIKEKENISNNRNSLTELSNKETLISPKKKQALYLQIPASQSTAETLSPSPFQKKRISFATQSVVSEKTDRSSNEDLTMKNQISQDATQTKRRASNKLKFQFISFPKERNSIQTDEQLISFSQNQLESQHQQQRQQKNLSLQQQESSKNIIKANSEQPLFKLLEKKEFIASKKNNLLQNSQSDQTLTYTQGSLQQQDSSVISPTSPKLTSLNKKRLLLVTGSQLNNFSNSISDKYYFNHSTTSSTQVNEITSPEDQNHFPLTHTNLFKEHLPQHLKEKSISRSSFDLLSKRFSSEISTPLLQGILKPKQRNIFAQNSQDIKGFNNKYNNYHEINRTDVSFHKSQFNPSKHIKMSQDLNESSQLKSSSSTVINRRKSLQNKQVLQNKQQKLYLDKLRQAQKNLQKLSIHQRKSVCPLHRSKWLFETMESKLNSQFGSISQKIAFNLDYIKQFYQCEYKTFKVITQLLTQRHPSINLIFIKDEKKSELYDDVVSIENQIINQQKLYQQSLKSQKTQSLRQFGGSSQGLEDEQLFLELSEFNEQLEHQCISKMKSRIQQVFNDIKISKQFVDEQIINFKTKKIYVPQALINRSYNYTNQRNDSFQDRIKKIENKLGSFDMISQESRDMQFEIFKLASNLKLQDQSKN